MVNLIWQKAYELLMLFEVIASRYHGPLFDAEWTNLAISKI